ncbi:MAG: hypothetical protein MZV70_30630 [Desulfobacterales bacterium]|nr:hypothetical protein [Desulfobacterales bacterium]
MSLPDGGTLAFEDAETEEQVIVDMSDAGFRTRTLTSLMRRKRLSLPGFSRAGIGNVSLMTTDPYDIPLQQFFRGMKRRRKNGRISITPHGSGVLRLYRPLVATYYVVLKKKRQEALIFFPYCS